MTPQNHYCSVTITPMDEDGCPIAGSLNNEYLLPAVKRTFDEDTSISAKLVYLDFKLNFLNKCDFQEIEAIKKAFDNSNEVFASKIVDSIIGWYLNYNKCDYQLRAKLCSLCGFSQQGMLIENKRYLLS